MRKGQGSVSSILVAAVVIILLAATAYLGTAALAERKTAQGEKLFLSGQFARAADMLKEAEKYNKFIMRKNARINEWLAESYFELEDFDSALEYYERVIKSEPDNARARYRLGLIYIGRKDYKSADGQKTELERMHTYEAREYANELSETMRDAAIKGVFKGIYDRLAPVLPKVPGLTDIFNEDPPTLDEGETGEPESDNVSPDTRESSEDLVPGGAGTSI